MKYVFHFRNRIQRPRQYFIVRNEKLPTLNKNSNTHWIFLKANCQECKCHFSQFGHPYVNIVYIHRISIQQKVNLSKIIAQSKNNDNLADLPAEVTETSKISAEHPEKHGPVFRPLLVKSHPPFWQRLNTTVLEFVSALFCNVCFGTRFLSVFLSVSGHWPDRPFLVRTNSAGAGSGAPTRKLAHVRKLLWTVSSGACMV